MARQGEITDKDMSVLREGDSAYVQAESHKSILKDYSLQHRVEANWDLGPEAQRDRMFKLIIDDYEVILDAEEVFRTIRWI